MDNKSNKVHNIELNSPFVQNLQKKKKPSTSTNEHNKNFNKFDYKDEYNKKKDIHKKNDPKKIKQSQNNKISKDIQNKYGLNEQNEYLEKHKKKDKLIKNNFIPNSINNNEFYKQENMKNFDEITKDNTKDIIINSINEIRLPTILIDISCDLMHFK